MTGQSCEYSDEGRKSRRCVALDHNSGKIRIVKNGPRQVPATKTKDDRAPKYKKRASDFQVSQSREHTS